MGCCVTKSLVIDSSDDNESTQLVHIPPSTRDNNIYSLSCLNGCNLTYVTTRSKKKISVLEIKPFYTAVTKKIVIFSHSSSSDIYTFFDDLRKFSSEYGIITVCYDYPGYGLSKGKPTEKQCYEALEAVIDFYNRRMYEIILIGISFGTGVVIDYSHKKDWHNPIILISPHKNISKNTIFGERIIFSTSSKIGDLFCPIKIFHGQSDNVVNVSQAKDLYKKLSNKAFSPVWIKDVGHYDVLNKINKRDINEVLEFVKNYD